jgi:hypothetical protein
VSERHGFTRLVVAGIKRNLLGQDIFSPYSLAEVQDYDFMPFAADEGLGLIPYRPLAGGLLTGKYVPGAAAPPGSRYAGPTYSYPHFSEPARPLLEVVERFRPLSCRIASAPQAGGCARRSCRRSTTSARICPVVSPSRRGTTASGGRLRRDRWMTWTARPR